MKCLSSLRPPALNWQLILLANGKALPQDILDLARSLTANFILLESKETMTPGKARNGAMKSAEGEWLFFIDDDASLFPNYWDVALPLLTDEKIDVFGGPDAPAKGMSALSLSLALTLSSPFCTGATFSRHKPVGQKLQVADEIKLTSCNLWVRRNSLNNVTFPEDFIRAEETLFLQRLKAFGLGIFYHPELRVSHYRRSKISELFRPTFYAGWYRSRLMRQKLTRNSHVFWLPSFFVLLHLVYFVDHFTFWYLARLYAGVIFLVSLSLAMKVRRFWLFPIIGFLHYFVVIMYGVGFLSERIGRKK